MPARYGDIGGTWTKAKRYSNIGGTWTPVNKRFGDIGGTWVQSYSSAIKWTYAVSAGITAGSANVISFTYGNDGTNSSMASLYAGSGGANAYCEVTYTFSSPFILKAGKTITIITTRDSAVDITELKINGNLVYSSGTIASNKTDTYTIPSDISISSISVRCTPEVGNYIKENVTVQVNVSADIGTFRLNNSGSSAQ